MDVVSLYIYSLKENNHDLHICSGYLYLIIKCPEDVLQSWEGQNTMVAVLGSSASATCWHPD